MIEFQFFFLEFRIPGKTMLLRIPMIDEKMLSNKRLYLDEKKKTGIK